MATKPIHAQLFLSNSYFDKKKFNPSQINLASIGINKPVGGLFTSTYNRRTYSDWYQWCTSERFEPQFYTHGTILYPKPDTHVFFIRNENVLKKILIPVRDVLHRFSKSEQEQLKQSKILINYLIIDYWNLMERDYHGVRCLRPICSYHTSLEFRDYIRDNFGPNVDMFSAGLNAWDVEQTIWFNVDWIDHTEHIKIPKYS